MTVKNNWDLSGYIVFTTDSEEDLILMLKDIIEKIEEGYTLFGESDCIFSYEVEFSDYGDKKNPTNVLRNLMNNENTGDTV